MRILNIYIKDLGGEFIPEKFEQISRTLGEPILENTAQVYSDYFLASGLAPIRVRVKEAKILLEDQPADLQMYVKLYSYGVVLFEYNLEIRNHSLDASWMFNAKKIIFDGCAENLDQLFQSDLKMTHDLLLPGCKKDYETPDFIDQFQIFIDSSSRTEDEIVFFAFPKEEPGHPPKKRRVLKRLELGEDEDRLYIMGKKAYLATPLDPFDIVNFIELSRVQLYELKIYDYILDKNIENTYQYLDQLPKEDRIFPLDWLRRDFKGQVRQVLKLIEIRMDLVDLIKDLTNTTKVTDDPYFELLYNELNETFHVSKWFTSVKEKIEEIEDVQKMILSRIDLSKSTALEITVIILIFIEIIIPVVDFIMIHWK